MPNRTRWEPLPDLPESPAGELETYSGADTELVVIVCYSLIARNPPRDLLLRFSRVRAWQVAEEGSPTFEAMWPESLAPPPPMISGKEWAGYRWPLQNWEGSRWRQMIADRIYTRGDVDRLSCHFICTLDQGLAVASEAPVDACWIAGASTGMRQRGNSVAEFFSTLREP